jgi:DNA-binding NarL/FixJ family response regulator
MKAVPDGKAVPPVAEDTAAQGDFMQLEHREQQVFRMLVSGLSNQQISCVLGIDKDGVKRHMRGILAKLRTAGPLARSDLLSTGTPARI